MESACKEKGGRDYKDISGLHETSVTFKVVVQFYFLIVHVCLYCMLKLTPEKSYSGPKLVVH